MTLTHDSYTFESAKHKLVEEVEPPQQRIKTLEFFGVNGVGLLTGDAGPSVLRCMITMDGYSTLATLQTAVETIKSKVKEGNKLTGTLTETIGGVDRTFEFCTFIGFREIQAPFYDGSGAYDWVQFGELLWLKRSLNS